MAAQIETYQDKGYGWRFRVWSTGNWKIVAVSSEPYDTEYNATRAAEWLKANVATAPITKAKV
jgi:uncharacterized protein YegP (UPF0339 family)